MNKTTDLLSHACPGTMIILVFTVGLLRASTQLLSRPGKAAWQGRDSPQMALHPALGIPK